MKTVLVRLMAIVAHVSEVTPGPLVLIVFTNNEDVIKRKEMKKTKTLTI